MSDIVRMMTTGEWEPGPSHAAKAAEWKLAIATVYDYAMEAGRVIRRAVGDDKEAIVGALVSRCRHIGNLAALTPQSLSASLKAVELEARLLRVIDTPIGAPREQAPYASLTPAEQRQRVLAVMAHCQEQLRRLDAATAITTTGESTDATTPRRIHEHRLEAAPGDAGAIGPISGGDADDVGRPPGDGG